MKRFGVFVMLLFTGVFIVITARSESHETGKMHTAPFGTAQDVQMAKLLWSAIEGYQENWTEYPGLEGFQPGNSPHGNYLKYYLNKTAKSNTDEFPYGSIIIKENYMAKDAKKLGPVTVMARLKGYDSDNYDWYWVKYNPDGTLDTNPKGMKLAGAVAQGMDSGCISCHAGADGDDYVFANDK